jgi:rare lipoprotein A
LLAIFSDRDLLRVQAGPYADRAEASLVAQRVRAAASLTPVVIERR